MRCRSQGACCRALLVSSGINGSSRWSRSKDSLAKDSRFKAVAKDSREQLFRDFVAEQKVCPTH